MIMNFLHLKHLAATICLAMASSYSFAQAVLPTSNDFDSATPNGWTESLQGGNFRYAGGQVGESCRLDQTNDNVMVFLADVPGPVTYYIKGQGSVPSGPDTFNIQESIDGINWTTMRQLTINDIDNANYVQYTDQPAVTSRYIRWHFKRKQSGRNIALDEIEIVEAPPSTHQEIVVAINGNNSPNNTTVVVGNSTTSTLRIENIGLADPLNVSNISFSGAAGSDFSISGVSTPFDVAALTYTDVTLNFNAGANGSRVATMVITNNDYNGDETTYTLELIGIGGSYATEPTAQATSLNISNVKSYTMNVDFTAANPAPENYIVLRKKGSAVTEIPTDGSTYSPGDWIGGAKVMYVGNGNTFKPKGIVANTQFHYAVFAYNGPAGYENYLTTSPLAGNTTTPDGNIQNYYSGIAGSNPDLLTLLHTKLAQNYNQIYYSNYASTILRDFVERDTTGGAKVINCVYSNYAYIFTGNFSYDVLSREHTYAHSWMDTWPDDQGVEYSDLHNLFPAHQDNANAVRSNVPFGEVVNVTSTFMEGTYGKDANGRNVYEPRDEHKGDAARALFYMATRYNGTGGNWGFPDPISFTVDYGQDQDVLKKWHWQDPPSNWEIARNDYIESQQGNRNPFVDSVNFACYINFLDMTYIATPGPESPCFVDGVAENNIENLSIYPNPTNGAFAMRVSLKENESATLRISDLAGRVVFERAQNLSSGGNSIVVQDANLSNGVYMLQLIGENEILTEKLVVK